MKKLYIAPNLKCICVESLGLICASHDEDEVETEDMFDLGNRWNEKNKTTVNGQYEIGAKQYNAWTTWDE